MTLRVRKKKSVARFIRAFLFPTAPDGRLNNERNIRSKQGQPILHRRVLKECTNRKNTCEKTCDENQSKEALTFIQFNCIRN